MSNHSTVVSVSHDQLTFVYDERTKITSPDRYRAIQEFLSSGAVDKLKASIHERTYVVLGGDGTFVRMAKVAHQEDADILGINFGSKGFLLHDREVFHNEVLDFEKRQYPILHASIQIGDKQIDGYAFNEFRIEREPHSSSLDLEISHRDIDKVKFSADGIMVATPAGSTGWSLNYGGFPLGHQSGENLITPFGNRYLNPTKVEDKGRIYIDKYTDRVAPLCILADGVPILRDYSGALHIVIERAEGFVNLLLEKSYRDHWNTKVYREQSFSTK